MRLGRKEKVYYFLFDERDLEKVSYTRGNVSLDP